MSPAFTHDLDAVQILVAVFFLFFAGLIYILRQEDKREGYPMIDLSPVNTPIEGFPPMPAPKIYNLLEGGTTQMPHDYGSSAMRGTALMRFAGAPLVPDGDPMLAELGPGAYPLRKDEPMLSEGEPQVQPLRLAHGWRVSKGDPDPRGVTVVDNRFVPVGVVAELWVDRSVKILRYLEVALTVPEAPDAHVLLPIYYADISKRRVRVRALLAHQFVHVPRIASLDQITAREEDRVSAYYANGLIFSRNAPGLSKRGAA
jgi:photosynthetic reaction center H subunit